MNEQYQSPEEQYFLDVNTRLKDIEEKQRLLKDRLLLVGKNIVDDRESNVEEMEMLKKTVLKLKEENLKMQEYLRKVSDQLGETARREEILVIKRQMDIIMQALGGSTDKK